MKRTDNETVDYLGDLAEKRFLLQLEYDELVQTFKDEEAALKQEYDEEFSALQHKIDEIEGEMWRGIDTNRSVLIKVGKKSFATLQAIFKLRSSSVKYKVTDKAEVLRVARRLRVVREIADPPKGDWLLNQRKLFGWLDKNPGWRHFFSDCIEDVSSHESLTIQPNGTYTAYYDNRRVSPPSVSIKKKS